MKKCNKCGEEKEESEFNICRRRKDHLDSTCRECRHKMNVKLYTEQEKLKKEHEQKEKRKKYLESLIEIKPDSLQTSFESKIEGEDTLFCDTAFLEAFFQKPIKKAKECK